MPSKKKTAKKKAKQAKRAKHSKKMKVARKRKPLDTSVTLKMDYRTAARLLLAARKEYGRQSDEEFAAVNIQLKEQVGQIAKKAQKRGIKVKTAK